MNGKRKCKMLKEIRKQIAKENDITYITTECKHQGNCKGTCPKCESEVRYLEAELEKRRKAGKTVAVAGIAAAMMLNASACTTETATESEAASVQTSSESVETVSDSVGQVVLPMGDYALPEDSSVSIEEPTPGEVPLPDETEEELMGDQAPEESEWETTGEEVPEESIEQDMGDVVPPDESEEELMGEPMNDESYED